MKRKTTIAAEHSDYSNSDTFKNGFVKFDLGNVYVPGMGNFHVKSEYPRLLPKFERKHVENCDVEKLSANLLVWITDVFEITGREEYFQELIFSCVLFALYTNPQLELHSEDMDVYLRFVFWLWYDDDVIESVVEETEYKIDCKAFKQGTNQLHSILIDKYDNNSMAKFEDVPNYPIFGHLFDLLLKLHNVCRERLPKYEFRVKNFSNYLQRYFTAMRWFCVDQIDERYSVESFKNYRKSVSLMDGVASVVALINGVTLSDEMLNSVTMSRLLEVANVFGGFANDLLGMKKEFANGQRDNLIVFMVSEKKIPLDVAVQQVCDLLASELADYSLVKDAILKEFNYDDNLIKYLDILDSLIDGHNVVYVESSRHQAVGSVLLTR